MSFVASFGLLLNPPFNAMKWSPADEGFCQVKPLVDSWFYFNSSHLVELERQEIYCKHSHLATWPFDVTHQRRNVNEEVIELMVKSLAIASLLSCR